MTAAPSRRWRAWAPGAVVTLSFLAARMIARSWLGMRFDWTSLSHFVQYAPVSLLRDDLVRTTFYLHHQAPLPNLVVGIAMKASAEHWLVVLDAFHCVLGFVMAHAMLEILRRLGVGAVWRAAVVSVYTASPVVVVYEMWLFYPQLVASMLVVATLLALRYAERPSLQRGAALFATLAVVAYTRSIYGTVWFVAAVIAVWVAIPTARRRTLVVAAAPLLLVVGLPIKTRIQTGGGYGDALLWPNLSSKIFFALPEEQRNELVADGLVSRTAPIEPFSTVEAFESAAHAKLGQSPQRVPVLDAREYDGQINKQNLAYMEVADRWSKPDAEYLLRNYPRTYLRAAVDALTVQSMRTATYDQNMGASANHRRTWPIERFLGFLLGTTKRGQMLSLMILAPAGLAFGLWVMLRREAFIASQRSTRVAIGFVTMTIAYTSLATALVSFADFSRYRFEVDALYWMLWVVMADRCIRALRRRAWRAWCSYAVVSLLRSARFIKARPSGGAR